MNLSNVKLILSREIRDQLRDRRTLFMIFVLPLLLYPLLGMSFFQVSQFMQAQPTSVLIVGAKDLVDLPPLVQNREFARGLFADSSKARLLKLHFAPDEPAGNLNEMPDRCAEARRAVQSGQYDAALYFPDDFANRLEDFRQAIEARAEQGEQSPQQTDPKVSLLVPSPEIIYTTANEKSQVAYSRLSGVLRRWTAEVGKTNLAAGGVPTSAAEPFDVQTADVAGETGYRGAAMWSKILPVLLLIWALTGAFYPAVDLCAGEKERGTLETLLSSPAERSEIVLGKLLTIMLFSMITAVLNLASIGVTGWLVLGDLAEFRAPPAMAVLWLAIALVPISAMFSALCLALAAFARSTKEGQYYLMPLLLVIMPLAILPMAPGVELNLGNSLIPVTGVVLLLRSVLEGGYLQALQFLPGVVAVTLAACLLSIRWAVDQFNSESVLFRESERLEMGLWLRRLVRDRQATPTVAAAVFCGVMILVVRFFMSFALESPEGFGDFAKLAVVTQLAVIATPALLMTIIFTNSPRRTLLLRCPAWRTIPAAVLLAVLLHPVANALQVVITQLYPVSEEVRAALESAEKILRTAPYWKIVLMIAVVPAICEELAFRGFILSGFRHLGHKWRAIVYSALFFGLAHAILQQSLIACLVGLVIGYLAVQSGSLLPGAIFHVLNNSLAVANSRITPEVLDRWPSLGTLASAVDGGGCIYHWPVVGICAFAGLVLLGWFAGLPYPKSAEEQLQEAIDRGLYED